MHLTALLLVCQVASTWFMVGLIWLIQIVHYPLFALVGPEQYANYQKQHQFLITWIVAPVISLELLTAIGLVVLRPTNVPTWASWTGLGLVLLIWGSTAILQVPCHSQLAERFDPAVHQTLVLGNWVRTIAWSMRGLLVAWITWKIIDVSGTIPSAG